MAIRIEAPEHAAEQAKRQLRGYISLESPTGAQTVAAVKLLCRAVLFLIRQWERAR